LLQHFEKGAWTRSAKTDAAHSGERQPHFVLLSFNVWFSQHRQHSRAEGLLRIIRSENADAVCLQEATSRFLKVLLADEFVRATYRVSSTADQFQELNEAIGYDSFMLCKPWCAGELHRYRLASKFARCVYINKTPHDFAVATIHLESLEENVRNRAMQMEQIYALLEELGVGDKTFFCGDLNHCKTLGEDHLRPSSIDVWPLLHPGDDGWTENEKVNLMLASKPGKVRFVVSLFFLRFLSISASAGAVRSDRDDGPRDGL
jgi:tyrosyl-DNA phosphodiesterase 2